MNRNIFKKISAFCFLLFIVFTLVACSQPQMYTVDFYDNDILINSQTVEEGNTLATFEHTNGVHELVGWFDSNEVKFDFTLPITSNLSLYAEWTNTCTFKNDDGTVFDTVEVKNGDTALAKATPTKANDDYNSYAFKSWKGSLECEGEDYEVIAEFTATKIANKVTFFGKDGVAISEAPVAIDAKVSQISYSVPDDNYYTYKLTGWKTADDIEYDFDTPVTKDLKLYPITKRTPLKIDFTDKVLSIMGDSVSTFYKAGDPFVSYYSGNDEFYYPKYCAMSRGSQTYWAQLITKLGMKLGVNESLSGSVCYGNNNRCAMSQERVNHLELNGDPDIIIAFIGINDNASGYSYENFENAYDTMLQRMMKTYPNAYILCTIHPYSNYHLNQPTNHAKYSEETRVAYNEIIMKLVEKYQLGYVDLEETQNINTWNTILNDNLHPHVEGHKKWYEQFLKDFKNYFNQTSEEIKITYNINCDDAVMPPRATYICHKGDDVTLPTPTREGYIFGGWYITNEFNTRQVKKLTNIGSDKTYYAEWLQTPPTGKFYIKYHLFGGSFTDPSQETYEFVSGMKGALPTPVKEGYKFDGWYIAPELVGNRVTSASANIKLYAKWIAI